MNQEELNELKARAEEAKKVGVLLAIAPEAVLELLAYAEKIQDQFIRIAPDVIDSVLVAGQARAEIERLQAENERLRAYTDPRLFAAASGVLEAWDDYNQVSVPSLIEALEEQFIPRLIEAVAWWDSLPFDPEKDTEKLPKYEG